MHEEVSTSKSTSKGLQGLNRPEKMKLRSQGHIEITLVGNIPKSDCNGAKFVPKSLESLKFATPLTFLGPRLNPENFFDLKYFLFCRD